MMFPHRVAALKRRGRMMSLTIQENLGVESLLLQMKRSQVRFGHFTRPAEVREIRSHSLLEKIWGSPRKSWNGAGDREVWIDLIILVLLDPQQEK